MRGAGGLQKGAACGTQGGWGGACFVPLTPAHRLVGRASADLHKSYRVKPMAVEGTTCRARGRGSSRAGWAAGQRLGRRPRRRCRAASVCGLHPAADVAIRNLQCTALQLQIKAHLEVIDGQPRVQAAPAVRARQQRQRLRRGPQAQRLAAGRQLAGGRVGRRLPQLQPLDLQVDQLFRQGMLGELRRPCIVARADHSAALLQPGSSEALQSRHRREPTCIWRRTTSSG